MQKVRDSIEEKEEKEKVLFQKKKELAELKLRSDFPSEHHGLNNSRNISLKIATETQYLPLESLNALSNPTD